MDKTRYELYTKGSYDLFLSNLKYLLETVGADKIRVRVPKIPKLNTYADVRLNYELLKNMGFTEIKIFDYIEIDKHKRISDVTLKNKNDFVDVANNNFIKDYIISEIIIKIAPLLDYHIKNFPEELWKDIEFIFEYDSTYENNLYSLKELIVSKLRECYDYLGLKYSFYVILKPVDYLKTTSNIDFDKKINDFITSQKGMYRRYCDDIIIVVPMTQEDVKGKNEEIAKFIYSTRDGIPNLELNEDKTEHFFTIMELQKR